MNMCALKTKYIKWAPVKRTHTDIPHIDCPVLNPCLPVPPLFSFTFPLSSPPSANCHVVLDLFIDGNNFLFIAVIPCLRGCVCKREFTERVICSIGRPSQRHQQEKCTCCVWHVQYGRCIADMDLHICWHCVKGSLPVSTLCVQTIT